MTTNGLIKEARTKADGEYKRIGPGRRESGPHGHQVSESSLIMIWPPEDQARQIPIRWLISYGREIPVTWNGGEN